MKLKTKIKKKLFSQEYFFYIMLIGALVLSATAAFFSIYGLSHLFSKVRTSVIIMASTLESCKLISVSAFYRFKKLLKKSIRIFLLISIVILMIITSLGIYAYLSHAFQGISDVVEKNIKKENILLTKINNIDDSLQIKKERLNVIKERYRSLNTLNKNQEKRLNDAIEKGNYITIRESRKEIKMSLAEIQGLDRVIGEISKEIEILNDNKNKLNNEIEKNNQELNEGDIGPLKFLSKLFNVKIEIVVNILIIIIIITFDPLAVVLILIANIIYMEKKKNNNNGKKRKYKKRRKRRKRRGKSDIIKNEEEVK